jgi:uncharacterized protein YdeI (YjbR/CyaY-like superfamily)
MSKAKRKLNVLYFKNSSSWRNWLFKNYKTKKEVWLLYHNKASNKLRIPYNDAVEEALSFGWIDSTVRKIDKDSYAQRFTPRNPKSRYSQANKERLRELVKQGKVMPSILATIGNILAESFIMPKDILMMIKSNKVAWKNFQHFSPSYKRIRISFIDGARNRPDEFRKRLKYFIKMTERNKKFGFGGIEKYY